jgi:Photosynthesis system II assembly factor YCF48
MRVFIFLFFSISIAICSNSGLTKGQPKPKNPIEIAQSNRFYQSNDDGQTWQDISNALPEKTNIKQIYSFGNEFYMLTSNGNLYQTNDLSKGNWRKQAVAAVSFGINEEKGDGVWDVYQLNSGIYATIYEKGFYKKIGNDTWIPMHNALNEKIVNSIVETVDGSIAVSTPSGIYSSKDMGKSWQQILKQNNITSLCEYNGILIAGSDDGLIRSTDNGKHWETVIQDKGVFFRTKVVDEHFVAIRDFDPNKDKSLFLKPKCSFISPDAGKNWQCIDALYSPIEDLYDFKKIGNTFYCGNGKGIFRSKDDSKTWELILPLKDAKQNERLEVIATEKTIFIAKIWAGC